MGDASRRISRKQVSLVVVLGVLAALVLVYALCRLSWSRRVDEAVEAIRAEGFPVELDELNAWYVRPSDENAADVLTLAFESFPRISAATAEVLPVEGYAELPGRTEPLPEGMKRTIAHHLKANADALALVHEGAGISECRWPINLTRGYATLLDHIGPLNRSSEVLLLESVYKAEQGDSDGAVDAIVAGVGVARSLDKEPVLISQLVRMSCLGRSLSALEQTLNRTPLKDSQLGQVQHALREAEDSDEFVRGIVGERCLAADMARYGAPGELVGASMKGVTVLPGMMELRNLTGICDLDAATLLEIFEPVVNAAHVPVKDRLAAMGTADPPDREIPSYCIVTRLLLPPGVHSVQANLRIIARMRAARAALAVERYRLAHGQLPESLDALVPEFLDEIPADPFGDGPVKCKRLENGYVVYSVGHDGEDDGGLEHGPDVDISEADLTFTVER